MILNNVLLQPPNKWALWKMFGTPPPSISGANSYWCHTHESTLVGMWNLVNEGILLKQTGSSFLTSKHSTYTLCVNEESTWGRNTKQTRKENVLQHTSRLQHDCYPPIGLHWENSLQTIQQASTTNVDRMLQHCLPNWTSLPSQQWPHCQKISTFSLPMYLKLPLTNMALSRTG